MNTEHENPYAHALAGLDIADPVSAFFDWCREREAIRQKREAGEAAPWTEDVIFQRGRFLNVFREDDRGTKAVLKFAEPVADRLPDLIHALFFARWCNRADTLSALEVSLLKEPARLRQALLAHTPWASEVYPVVPACWGGRTYERLDACTDMFPLCRTFLEEAIASAAGNVMTANDAINAQFQMTNDFPIFMALVDLALFRPDVMRPDSPVPTGIGAAPFLDLLQRHLNCADHQETAYKMIALQRSYWPEARRVFTPIDIEYLSCECRKYYSYVNGTKKFEGKNAFVPVSG